jgi:hypothetical protein
MTCFNVFSAQYAYYVLGLLKWQKLVILKTSKESENIENLKAKFLLFFRFSDGFSSMCILLLKRLW